MSNKVNLRELILVPSVITLAVTLLRLVGELQGWSPALFNRQPGGGGAVVGIVWFVFIFGAWFAWKLLDAGHTPEARWRPLGYGFLGVLTMFVPGFGAQALKLPMGAVFVIFVVASIAALFVGLRGWPTLGRTLLAYGLAARIPVVIVMLLAMLGNWGTHYDAAPPELPPMGTLAKWFWIGVVPQLTTWVAFTVVVGMFCGGIVAAARAEKRVVTA